MGLLHIHYFLLLLFSYHLLHTTSIALPPSTANPHTLLQPTKPIYNNNNNNISAPPTLTVEQNVENLIQWVTSRHPAHILSIRLRVSDHDLPILTLSDEISLFRKIDCVFLLPSYTPPRSLSISNQWPVHWGAWRAPIPEPYHEDWLRLPWKTIFRRMSVEWADHLMKREGYVGEYGAVVLLSMAGRPRGWCFDEVDLEPDLIGSVMVEITGEVYTFNGCMDDPV
ncbi:MAG: hypothetical protein Q9221_005612 [Calogaya cf. arnoldii]